MRLQERYGSKLLEEDLEFLKSKISTIDAKVLRGELCKGDCSSRSECPTHTCGPTSPRSHYAILRRTRRTDNNSEPLSPRSQRIAQEEFRDKRKSVKSWPNHQQSVTSPDRSRTSRQQFFSPARSSFRASSYSPQPDRMVTKAAVGSAAKTATRQQSPSAAVHNGKNSIQNGHSSRTEHDPNQGRRHNGEVESGRREGEQTGTKNGWDNRSEKRRSTDRENNQSENRTSKEGRVNQSENRNSREGDNCQVAVESEVRKVLPVRGEVVRHKLSEYSPIKQDISPRTSQTSPERPLSARSNGHGSARHSTSNSHLDPVMLRSQSTSPPPHGGSRHSGQRSAPGSQSSSRHQSPAGQSVPTIHLPTNADHQKSKKKSFRHSFHFGSGFRKPTSTDGNENMNISNKNLIVDPEAEVQSDGEVQNSANLKNQARSRGTRRSFRLFSSLGKLRLGSKDEDNNSAPASLNTTPRREDPTKRHKDSYNIILEHRMRQASGQINGQSPARLSDNWTLSSREGRQQPASANSSRHDNSGDVNQSPVASLANTSNPSPRASSTPLDRSPQHHQQQQESQPSDRPYGSGHTSPQANGQSHVMLRKTGPATPRTSSEPEEAPLEAAPPPIATTTILDLDEILDGDGEGEEEEETVTDGGATGLENPPAFHRSNGRVYFNNEVQAGNEEQMQRRHEEELELRKRNAKEYKDLHKKKPRNFMDLLTRNRNHGIVGGKYSPNKTPGKEEGQEDRGSNSNSSSGGTADSAVTPATRDVTQNGGRKFSSHDGAVGGSLTRVNDGRQPARLGQIMRVLRGTRSADLLMEDDDVVCDSPAPTYASLPPRNISPLPLSYKMDRIRHVQEKKRRIHESLKNLGLVDENEVTGGTRRTASRSYSTLPRTRSVPAR